MIKVCCDGCGKELDLESCCYDITTKKVKVSNKLPPKQKPCGEDITSATTSLFSNVFFPETNNLNSSNIELTVCEECYMKFCNALDNTIW